MAKEVDCIPITSDKATDRSERLREGTHDEVHLVGKSEMITHTTTVLSKHSDTMSLIDHDRTVVLMLELYDLRKLSEVAFHRENAVNDDELHCIIRQLLEDILKILHVVVLIFQLTCEGETTSINDRSVITVIADNIVLTTTYHCHHACIDRETSREAESFILAHKLSKVFFQFNVNVEGAIKETTSCTTSAVLVDGSLGSFTDSLITYKASVSIGTEHKNFMSSHINFCALLAGDFTEVRINTCFHKLLWQAVTFKFFL